MINNILAAARPSLWLSLTVSLVALVAKVMA